MTALIFFVLIEALGEAGNSIVTLTLHFSNSCTLFSGDLRTERPNRLLPRPAHPHRDSEGLRRAEGEDPAGAEAVR